MKRGCCMKNATASFFITRYRVPEINSLNHRYLTTRMQFLRMTIRFFSCPCHPFSRYGSSTDRPEPAEYWKTGTVLRITIMATAWILSLYKVLVKNSRYGTSSDRIRFFFFCGSSERHGTVTAIGYKPAIIYHSGYDYTKQVFPDPTDDLWYPDFVRCNYISMANAWRFLKRLLLNQIPDDDYEIARKNLDVYSLRLAALDYPMGCTDEL